MSFSTHDAPSFLRGIDSFNRRAYFDSHDQWEQCWIAEGRPNSGFFKGLIQMAVAMHHLTHHNLPGAKKLLARAHETLAPFRPQHLDLDVDALLAQADQCVDYAESAEATETLPAELVPRIHLKPAPNAQRR